MNETAVLNVSDTALFDVGDKFYIDVPVYTKWNRVLYWLIGRPIPVKSKAFYVTEVCSDTCLEIVR